MSFQEKHPVGSKGWFKGEEQFGARGSIATCIQLLLQEAISFQKCLELIRLVVVPWRKEINWEVDIKAPWENLDWNSENKFQDSLRFLIETVEQLGVRALDDAGQVRLDAAIKSAKETLEGTA